jgi:hypothetical protein
MTLATSSATDLCTLEAQLVFGDANPVPFYAISTIQVSAAYAHTLTLQTLPPTLTFELRTNDVDNSQSLRFHLIRNT